jgi:two-component system, LytTR family, sensor kinase
MSLSFSNNKLRLFLHIIAWSILFVVPAYLYLLTREPGQNYLFLIAVYIQTIAYAIIFYVNYLWLGPKFYFNKRRKLYLLFATLLVVVMAASIEVTHEHIFPMTRERRQFQEDNKQPPRPMPKPMKSWPMYNFVLNSFLITGFSIGLCMSEKLIKNEQMRKEAEKEKLNSELAFLKNQISPHFFFNTLNNIYSLIQINTGDAQNAVIKLSKMMRYLLYESESGITKMSSEIEFMRSYIDLMKLRLSNTVDLKIDFPSEFEDFTLPPLLFIPFIENAFKHGISYNEKSFIQISLIIRNQQVFFTCANSIGPSNQQPSGSDPGIGLENVKKRLLLLYPQKHGLCIKQTETTYSIALTLDISELNS